MMKSMKKSQNSVLLGLIAGLGLGITTVSPAHATVTGTIYPHVVTYVNNGNGSYTITVNVHYKLTSPFAVDTKTNSRCYYTVAQQGYPTPAEYPICSAEVSDRPGPIHPIDSYWSYLGSIPTTSNKTYYVQTKIKEAVYPYAAIKDFTDGFITP